MAIYKYRGLDKKGKEVKGEINADTESQAKGKIKTMGIMLMDIKEQKSQKKKSGFSFGAPVSIQDLSLMTRQLATLIKAKVQIVEAFSALQDQSDNETLKVILSEVKQKVNEGSTISAALADYPKVFNNIYINMVEAGESSGTLDVVLMRLAEFSENQVRLKAKIKGAMLYPVIMMVVGSIMMMIIFMFVIPKITKVFETMKKELPLATQICIAISNFLKSYWYTIPIGVFTAWFLFDKWKSSKKGEPIWHTFLLKAPVLGELTKMINVSRFTSTLGTLLASGVPILPAMKIVNNLVENVHMSNAVQESRVAISEGASMVGPLVKCGYFPTMVTHMMTLGEKSGELEEMLKIISDNYEEQVDEKLSGLTSILEPIMMVFMGLAVGFIVMAVVVPMMDIGH